MKIRKFSVICFAAIVITLIFIKISNTNKVEGWDDFKEEVITNCSFITDVNIDSITPPDIYINYKVNRKLEMKDIDTAFVLTKNYIHEEKVFDDLKKLHMRKFKYSFANINISFKYKQDKDSFKCKIFSPSGVDGEPKYNNSFNTWYISINDEPTREYIIAPK